MTKFTYIIVDEDYQVTGTNDDNIAQQHAKDELTVVVNAETGKILYDGDTQDLVEQTLFRL